MPSVTPEMPSADFVSSHDCCGQVRRKDCIDVVKRFKRRYVFEYEDPHFAGSRCPWHRQIRCRHGFIAPAGGTKLHGYGTGAAAKKLVDLAKKDDRFVITQGSSKEVGVNFDVEHIAPVATILKAKRR